ncbi:MAG: phosphatase PAP2 family protein [Labedaea sp.]
MGPSRSWWERLNRAERALLADLPVLPESPPNPVVTAVTTAGRGGVLWLLLCAAEALRRGGDRRLARHAAVGVAAALAASNALKRLVPYRPRPEPPGGPARRSLPERPDSSSFPSSHAASAAAFSTAIMLHHGRRALLVAPLAATAIYGRLRTRVHWPTDLAAGMALGAGSALLTWRAHRSRTG